MPSGASAPSLAVIMTGRSQEHRSIQSDTDTVFETIRERNRILQFKEIVKNADQPILTRLTTMNAYSLWEITVRLPQRYHFQFLSPPYS
jgi:hypothetical protein